MEENNRASCYRIEEGRPTLGWVWVKADLSKEESEDEERARTGLMGKGPQAGEGSYQASWGSSWVNIRNRKKAGWMVESKGESGMKWFWKAHWRVFFYAREWHASGHIKKNDGGHVEKWSGPGREESRINSWRVFIVAHGSLKGRMSAERKKVNRFERDFESIRVNSMKISIFGCFLLIKVAISYGLV